MKTFCIIALLAFSVNSFGQVNREWVKRFNGSDNRFDIANTMKLDENGNIIVYGNTASTSTLSDIVVIKYSPAGNVLWQTTFNGYSNSVDECKSAILDDAGNSYITGFTADTNQVVKIVTLKLNSSGVILWSKVFLPPAYNQGLGLSITNDNNGNIYTCGSTRRTNGSNTVTIIKYSASGELLNTAFFNKTLTSSETPVNICTDNAGNVYVLSSSNANSGLNDILLLKFTGSLGFVWQSAFSGNSAGNDIPVEMLISRDNKLVVAAAINNDPGGLDYGIYRFDTSSAMIMQYIYNGTGNNQDIPYAITTDTANNVFVTGSSRNYDTLGSEDFYTMKINPAGILLWGKRYDGNGRGLDYGTSISVDKRGNVFAGGTTDKHYFHQQYGLLKYGSTGDLFWLEEYSVQENSEDFIYTTLSDNNNCVYVTGISFDSTSDYDIATIKYSETIGIEPISNEVPNEFKLIGNYPNPFNPVTKIKFSVPSNVKSRYGGTSSETSNVVKLIVYNLMGESVTTLFNQKLLPGVYEVEFMGSDLASGVYFCRMETGGFSKSIKIMLLK